MVLSQRLPILTCLVVIGATAPSLGAEPAEPLLRGKLPSGVFVQSSLLAPDQQTQAIGMKLGGQIQRVSNSVIRVHGSPIKVNVIAAADDASAQAILASLEKIKPHPFCLRKDLLVIEYVGQNLEEALAIKTSYELGLREKPSSVRYQIAAELAVIDEADYMACNPLFNQFLSLQHAPGGDARRQIGELARKFRFGQSLVLRNPKLGKVPAEYQSQPASTASKESGATVTYTFEKPPAREAVSYVTASMAITVDDSGLTEQSDAPPASLTAATPFWPAEDPQVKALAAQITQGKNSNGAKALAILEWLAPGKNIQYSGQTGSRYGTAQVLEQKFGHCWDFSDCFVTLCRAAGVPSRQVAGWLYGASGHVWAEFYREGRGWQQVDPTGGGELRCGIYHIPYFTSEDGPMPIVYLAMPKIVPVTGAK
jgi:hypothetical protein